MSKCLNESYITLDAAEVCIRAERALEGLRQERSRMVDRTIDLTLERHNRDFLNRLFRRQWTREQARHWLESEKGMGAILEGHFLREAKGWAVQDEEALVQIIGIAQSGVPVVQVSRSDHALFHYVRFRR